jgi:hypothetical protein
MARGGGGLPPLPEGVDVSNLQAILQEDGRIHLFVYRDDGAVLEAYQKTVNGGWEGNEPGIKAKWYSLGNPGK